MEQQVTRSVEPDDVMTVPEVARAMRLHVTTVTSMCRNGQFGAYRVGNGRGRWRIPVGGYKAHIAENRPPVTA